MKSLIRSVDKPLRMSCDFMCQMGAAKIEADTPLADCKRSFVAETESSLNVYCRARVAITAQQP